ncbi:MAG: fibronectin type III domain-containing protein [Candidatus Scalindua sp.]|nr:fibronectin type III domain-containing protein [Candidatus Scalindua sp.]
MSLINIPYQFRCANTSLYLLFNFILFISSILISFVYSSVAYSAQATVIPINWVDTIGVNVKGNSITKTASAAWGNGGAASLESFTGDGGVEFVESAANASATGRPMCGLSSTNRDASYDTIEYAIYLRNTGSVVQLQVYEKGTDKGTFGTYRVGDVFRVERIGRTIFYKRNGNTFYTSTTPTDLPLLVDTAIYNNGGEIRDAKVFRISKPPRVITDLGTFPVTWVDSVGIKVDYNSITKIASAAWGNGGALSLESFTGNGGVEFVASAADASANGRPMCGLSSTNRNASYNTIEYAIFLRNTGSVMQLQVYENGIGKGTFGTYRVGDVFRVERVGSTIVYKKNGVTFYTSATPTDLPLLVDAAIYNNGGNLKDVKLFKVSGPKTVNKDIVQVSFTWKPNTEKDLAGYKIHYGNSRRNYDSHINVGNQTNYTITGLVKGKTYYFAATAYDFAGNESNYSAEAVYNGSNIVNSPLKLSLAGVHTGAVTVNNVSLNDTQDVTVARTNTNRPPVLEMMANIFVNEGATITLNPAATDPDGDSLTFTYSGWMNSDTYTTNYGDAGDHTVTVTVSDRLLTDSQDIKIKVLNTTRPPVLEPIADITVKKGNTITLNPSATDPDGDSLTFTYSGWMTSNTYTTNFDDLGVHVVTVTVSDGFLTDSQDVTIIVVESSLIGYWKFNEGSGTTVEDSSGNGNEGTIIGNATWTTGKNGGGLDFDGSDDYVDVGDIDLTDAFTIAAWIKKSGMGKNMIVGKSYHTYQFFVSPAGGLAYQRNSGTPLDFNAKLEIETWYHVAVTFDTTNGMVMYLDGSKVVTDSDTSTTNESDFVTKIGASDGTAQDFFNGTIDDVLLYKRALSAEEILDLYNQSK